MKKFTIMALALCLTFALAAPAKAVDADFSGYYRVRGVSVEHWDLLSTTAPHDFMNMSFRLQTVFKVSDNLSVTTRFDALDGHVWGTTDDAATSGAAGNISFDRAYMTIKSGIGTFTIGRQAGGGWGTTFADSVTEKDRIKYAKVIDDLTLLAIFQKNTETDTAATVDGAADEDSATYYIGAKKKMENITAGVLLALTNDKTSADAPITKYGILPYFVGKFGPLSIQGELNYNWGETDNLSTADEDIKELGYNIEASFNLGAATVLAGYAFTSGDNGTAANEDSSFGGVGNDWEKLFILTTNEVPALTTLGGLSNVSSAGVSALEVDFGSKIIYAGVVVAPVENASLTFAAGNAKADQVSGTYKDDYGTEYDLTLNWKIYDNLTYTAIAAYLDAGEFYYGSTGVKPANFEDTYALFHQLQLSF